MNFWNFLFLLSSVEGKGGKMALSYIFICVCVCTLMYHIYYIACSATSGAFYCIFEVAVVNFINHSNFSWRCDCLLTVVSERDISL